MNSTSDFANKPTFQRCLRGARGTEVRDDVEGGSLACRISLRYCRTQLWKAGKENVISCSEYGLNCKLTKCNNFRKLILLKLKSDILFLQFYFNLDFIAITQKPRRIENFYFTALIYSFK